MRGAMLVVGLLFVGGGMELGAQSVWALREGQRVKIAGSAVKGEFTIQRADADVIVVRGPAGDTIPIARSAISRLAVSEGNRSRSAGMVRGAAWGFGAGAVVGGGVGYGTAREGEIFSPGESALILGAMFGVVGGVAGGVVGAMNPGERWRRVPIQRITVAPTRSGGIAASVAVPY